MCMIVAFSAKSKVAEKDIKVYKHLCVINGCYYSSIKYFTYNFGNRYNITIKEEENENNWKYSSSDELESYGIEPEDFRSSVRYKRIKVIGQGFHSYGSLKRALQHCDKGNIAEFIIPKGSLYFHSKSNLYVSNEIIPVKMLES